MFVGIDVHKHTHAAALLDERGGELGVLTFANSPAGYQRLIGWLAERDAAQAVIGVESPGSYGRCLTGALAAAGHEVLHVPAWRTHRERRRQGPGKTDPGDALAIADVVRRKRAELGPALQPELVRAISILELQRRRFVLDRTQAIQRLRSDWTQVDPVAEAKVVHLDRQRELRRLKRVSFGDGLVERIAATTIRQLARDIEDLNGRIADLEAEIAALLRAARQPGRRPARRRQPDRRRTDLARRRRPPLQGRRCVRALLRRRADSLRLGQTAGRHRLHRGGNRQLNAALYRIAIVQQRHHPDAKAFLTRKIGEGKTPREARRALKRHLTNVVYRRLLAWAENTPAMNPLT